MAKLTSKTRHRQQTSSRRTTWNVIMKTPAWSDGMKDASVGVFNPDKPEWSSITDGWNYERGWHFARRTGRVELKWDRKGVVSKDDQAAAARLYVSKAFL